MDIEYYVMDKNKTGSKNNSINIEILEEMNKYKDYHKDRNNYSVYSFKESPDAFKKNLDVWNLIEKEGKDILPITCIDEKIYKVRSLLNVFELSCLTGIAISFQEEPNDSE